MEFEDTNGSKSIAPKKNTEKKEFNHLLEQLELDVSFMYGFIFLFLFFTGFMMYKTRQSDVGGKNQCKTKNIKNIKEMKESFENEYNPRRGKLTTDELLVLIKTNVDNQRKNHNKKLKLNSNLNESNVPITKPKKISGGNQMEEKIENEPESQGIIQMNEEIEKNYCDRDEKVETEFGIEMRGGHIEEDDDNSLFLEMMELEPNVTNKEKEEDEEEINHSKSNQNTNLRSSQIKIQNIEYEGTKEPKDKKNLEEYTNYNETEMGQGIEGTYDHSTCILSIAGDGEMKDYIFGAPWNNIKESIMILKIGNRIKKIGTFAFYYCIGLSSVSIENPSILTIISDNAFESCTNLSSITFPTSVTTIGNDAFSQCNRIDTIIIPSGVSQIGVGAFGLCAHLKKIYVDENNEHYSSSDVGLLYNKNQTLLIQGGGAILSILFAPNTTNIGNKALYKCENLADLKIPPNIISIESQAFSSCSKLITILVLPGNEFYSSDSQGILYNKNQTTLIQCGGGNSGNITIPDSVNIIESHGFDGCQLITSVAIPSRVSKIGSKSFFGCYSLTNISVDYENQVYSSDPQGILYNANQTRLIQCGGGIRGTIIIPSCVTTIEEFAFYECLFLNAITIPANTTIGNWAFSNCYKLAEVTISGDITTLGFFAFEKCLLLTSVKYCGITNPSFSETFLPFDETPLQSDANKILVHQNYHESSFCGITNISKVLDDNCFIILPKTNDFSSLMKTRYNSWKYGIVYICLIK